MKTQIYIEDGTVQLVLTPQTEFEGKALATLGDKPLKAKLFSGAFYDVRGGWIKDSWIKDRAYTESEKSLVLQATDQEG